MKKFNKIILCFIILILITTTIYAHGGNISGYNVKNSDKIEFYSGSYYGYHQEKGVTHYHQVKWNDTTNKWEIVSSSVYYKKDGDEFKLLKNILDKDLLVEYVEFIRIVDGDTAMFNVDGKDLKIRFLGINTTESVKVGTDVQLYSKEASSFTENLLQNASQIRLEFDYDDNLFANKQSEPKNKNIDQYNRLLAWVFVDDRLLQEELVKNGLAYTYMLTNSQKYAGVLQQAEEYAKENKFNLWSDDEYVPTEEDTENILETDDNKTIESNFSVIIAAAILAIILSIIELLRKRETKKF